jgi:hypothetical protein
MIRKSAQRFSEKIMRKEDGAWQTPGDESHFGFGTHK